MLLQTKGPFVKHAIPQFASDVGRLYPDSPEASRATRAGSRLGFLILEDSPWKACEPEIGQDCAYGPYRRLDDKCITE